MNTASGVRGVHQAHRASVRVIHGQVGRGRGRAPAERHVLELHPAGDGVGHSRQRVPRPGDRLEERDRPHHAARTEALPAVGGDELVDARDVGPGERIAVLHDHDAAAADGDERAAGRGAGRGDRVGDVAFRRATGQPAELQRSRRVLRPRPGDVRRPSRIHRHPGPEAAADVERPGDRRSGESDDEHGNAHKPPGTHESPPASRHPAPDDTAPSSGERARTQHHRESRRASQEHVSR